MSWNYRVMHKTNPFDEEEFGIVEAYYDNNGNVNGWTADFIEPIGETAEELKVVLERMLDALNQDILEDED